jgi:RNA methyltransferase, TrmH family
LITSSANPLVRRLRKLRHRKFRESEGVFLIEGIAHVRQALDHEAQLERIFYCPELLRSEPALAAVERIRERGTEVTVLGREAFESIVERDHPSGLGAVAVMNQRDISELKPSSGTTIVGLVDIGNPGNLGSIIRTVDAVGGQAVVVMGDSTDEYHPQAVKASMGTLFSVPVYRCATPHALLEWGAGVGLAIVTTSARARQSLWDVQLPDSAVYLFGSEAQGLGPEVLAAGQLSVSMPMEGAASSLNLAVAVGVVLYEVKRRRKA